MFGFPGDFDKHFISAWQEPFTGFELKWIEVEICRQAMIPTNVTDLFEKMKSTYPDLQEMHQSKFYRIVSSLVDDGYLEDHQDGRAKIIQTLPQGAKELGRITRYFFELQMERVKGTLWQDLIQKITDNTGCLLDSKVLVVGPEYNAVNILIRECTKCVQFNGDKKDLKKYHSNFMFLNYHANLQGKIPDSVIVELEDIDDWLPKSNTFDNVILFNPLTSFPEKAVSILVEAKRVIKSEGKIILFELTREDSTILSTFMREAALLLNYSNPSHNWEVPEHAVDKIEIETWIRNAELEIVEEFPDVISTIYVLN